ncbi:MAG: YcxB family protein [Floccifex sp.]
MVKQSLLIDQEEREAIVELMIECNPRFHKTEKICLIVAIIGLLCGIFFFFCGSIVVPILFVFHFLFFLYMSKSGFKKKMAKSISKEFPEDGTLMRTYILNEDGISLRSKYGFDSYKWDCIEKCGKYYHYFYFYRSDGQIMILDHRNLSEEEKEEVLLYMKKCGECNGIK